LTDQHIDSGVSKEGTRTVNSSASCPVQLLGRGLATAPSGGLFSILIWGIYAGNKGQLSKSLPNGGYLEAVCIDAVIRLTSTAVPIMIICRDQDEQVHKRYSQCVMPISMEQYACDSADTHAKTTPLTSALLKVRQIMYAEKHALSVGFPGS